jgi:hypothetical protein
MQNLVLPASFALFAASITSSTPISFSAFNFVSPFHDELCAQ